jgi:acetyl-CoA carboxylase, biotin carboxylase subunit
MSKMGTKAVDRETVKAADVPIVPDTDGIIEDINEDVFTARSIGYPVS